MNDPTARAARNPVPVTGGRSRWTVACAVGALVALAACGPTMPTQTIAPIATPAAQAAIPVEVRSSRMATTVSPARAAPCGGVRYPIDGRAAFEATVVTAAGSAAGGAVRRVRVYGERLVFNYGAGPAMLGQVMLAPTATITTHLHIDTTHGRVRARIQANGTGTRSLNGFVGCEVFSEALADAYREALRDLSSQIAERLYLAGASLAAAPARR
jgi:hypothetical protein